MYQSLNKLKERIEILSKEEILKLCEFQEKLKKFIKDGRYEEGVRYAINTLNNAKDEGQTLKNCIKHEIVKMYSSCILYLMNTNPNSPNIKKYFNECNFYIENNIFSYLLKQKNYACFLSQSHHAKQAQTIYNKVYKIELINYLSNQSCKLDLLAEMCSNLSSLEGGLKNHNDALVYGMEALAISQFDKIFGESPNPKTFINYYTVGTQQEYLKRNIDAKASFAYSKKYLKEENGDPKEFQFIKKINCFSEDINIIGFRESLENPEIAYLKFPKRTNLLYDK